MQFVTRAGSWLAALVVALAAGCGDPPASEYPPQQVYVEDTTLGPGDVFEVRVFKQAGMSGKYSVDSDGHFTFPLIGDVVAAGMTPSAVEQDIRTRLADGYLRDPQVSILVLEYKSKKVSVLGQVRKPGSFPLATGMTLVQAISQAGGLNAIANGERINLTRKHKDDSTTVVLSFDAITEGRSPDLPLQAGDRIYVNERVF